MERKEAYVKIKELNLQEECKKKYGKNFTQCKTEELVNLIMIRETVKKSTRKLNTNNVEKGDVKDLWSVTKDLIETLHSKHILLDSEVKRILG